MAKQRLGTWRGAFGSHAEWGLISSQYMAAGMEQPHFTLAMGRGLDSLERAGLPP